MQLIDCLFKKSECDYTTTQGVAAFSSYLFMLPVFFVASFTPPDPADPAPFLKQYPASPAIFNFSCSKIEYELLNSIQVYKIPEGNQPLFSLFFRLCASEMIMGFKLYLF